MLRGMGLILSAAAVTDRGLIRTNNEDSAYAGRRIVAVADGVGGAPAGELASGITIRCLTPLEHAPDPPHPDEPVASLRAAVDAANRAIHQAAESNPANEGMGTTVTALLLCVDHTGEARMGLLHVGDSRCYLYRGAKLSQITKDDTFVQSLVDHGVLSAEDARTHPRRSLVTQAVQGLGLTPACDVLRPRRGDRFLLCSDGLSDVVTDDAIGQVMSSDPDPRQCAERLVKLALAAGAPDNVTVVVADVTCEVEASPR
jgi:serine/threonine protein phosphatase PrpC